MRYFLASFCIFLSVFLLASKSSAQESKVEYNGEVIVDSDLDGLTDKGEQQIYGTNPGNQDTDGDGYLDGAEVIDGTNPLDGADYPGHRAAAPAEIQKQSETPWAWYVTRSAGLLAFVFLWLTIFLGLSIRNPLLKKIIEPVYSFDFHCFLAAAAVFWAAIHGTSLLLDRHAGLAFVDIAVPFFAQTFLVNVNYMALGIMAFYMMAVMTITSYLRRHIKHWLWRALHFLNPLAFIFVVAHGYLIGTDTKNFWIGNAFLLASFLLALLYLSSLGFVLWKKFRASSVEEILNK